MPFYRSYRGGQSTEVTNADTDTWVDAGVLTATFESGVDFFVAFQTNLRVESHLAQRTQVRVWDGTTAYREFAVANSWDANNPDEYRLYFNLFKITGTGSSKTLRIQIKPTIDGVTSRAKDSWMVAFQRSPGTLWGEFTDRQTNASSTNWTDVIGVGPFTANGGDYYVLGGGIFDAASDASSAPNRHRLSNSDGTVLTTSDLGYVARSTVEKYPRALGHKFSSLSGSQYLLYQMDTEVAYELGVRESWIMAIPASDYNAIYSSVSSTSSGTSTTATDVTGSPLTFTPTAGNTLLTLGVFASGGTSPTLSSRAIFVDGDGYTVQTISQPHIALTSATGSYSSGVVNLRTATAVSQTAKYQRRSETNSTTSFVRTNSTIWVFDLGFDAGPTRVGTLDKTLDPTTLSSDVLHDRSADLSSTLGSLSIESESLTERQGAITATLGSLSSSSDSSAQITISSSPVLGSSTLTAFATNTNPSSGGGDVIPPFASMASHAVGNPTVLFNLGIAGVLDSGLAALTATSDAFNFAGTRLSSELGALSFASTGSTLAGGALNSELGILGSSIVSGLIVGGSLSVSLGALDLLFESEAAVRASLTQTLLSPIVEAGTIVYARNLDFNKTLSPATLSSVGVLINSGYTTRTLGEPTFTSTGFVPFNYILRWVRSWRPVALYAITSPNPVSGSRLGAGSVTTITTIVSAYNGVPPYTFQWTGYGVTVNSPTSSNTTFTGTVTSGQSVQASATCLVTDSLGATYEVEVNVLLESQKNSLTPVFLTTNSPAFGAATFSQRHLFTANNLATSSPIMGTPSTKPTNFLTASNLTTSSPVLPSLALTVRRNLIANALVASAPVIGTPAAVVVRPLAATSLSTSSPVLPTLSVIQKHLLTSTGLSTSSPAFGAPATVQPAWTPLDAPSGEILEWWDAHDNTKVSINGSNRVTSWTGSVSSTVLTPTASGREPYWVANAFGTGVGGLQCQTNQNLQKATIPSTWSGVNETWLWAIASYNGGSTQSTLLSTGGSSTSNTRHLSRSSGGNPRLATGGDSNNDNFLGTSWTAPRIFGARYGAEGFRSRLNGGWGEERQDLTTQPMNTSSTDRIRVFQSAQGSDVERFVGHCGDLAVFSGLASLDTILKYEGYLAHKYGQTALLPVSHPYKSAPPTTAFSGQTTFAFTTASNAKAIVWGTRDITLSTPDAGVTQAIINVHGDNRNADDYHDSLFNGLLQSGKQLQTVLLTPEFRRYSPETGYENWSSEEWKYGIEGTMGLSSFKLLDELIERLADKDKYPNLNRIVLFGHSAGGQMMQRYTMGSRVVATDVELVWIPSNPGSYCYPTNQRPNLTGSGYITSVSGCSGFNAYRYGLGSGLNTYMTTTGVTTMRAQYQNRNVIYLLGEADTATDSGLDTGCEANAQGSQRFDRGTRFYQYMQDIYPGHNHSKITLSGVGHDHNAVILSALGNATIFGT